MNRRSILLVLLGAVITLAGCQTAYYGAMEKVGYHKRDLLVDRVEDARDEQEEVKEQFASALEEFSSVLNFQGGDLEALYKRLQRELDDSEARAVAVRERIDAVENVARALFTEWEAELNQYANQEMKRSSQRQLRETQDRYKQLINAMRRAESKIHPVLQPMRDQVLFLKHNLNAQAIASIQNEVGTIELEVTALIKDMEAAIAEADAFIATMQ